MPTNTKTALLDSAEQAARALGFDAFSYADLAKDVGIRTSSIHYYFPTKAALATALMQRYYDELQDVCKAIDAAEMPASARLSALIDRYATALDGGNSLCLCVSFSISRESFPQEVIQQISRFRAMVLQWLTNTFADGKRDGSVENVKDPSKEAAAALALLEGAQLAARAEKKVALFHDAVQILKSRLSQTI